MKLDVEPYRLKACFVALTLFEHDSQHHEQCYKQVVECEHLGRHCPRPGESTEGEDGDGQDTS